VTAPLGAVPGIPVREFPRRRISGAAKSGEHAAITHGRRQGSIMTVHHITRALAGAGLFATVALNAASVWAVASDYRFEVAEVKPAAAGKSDITLRLIHTPDKKPVNDAVIFQVSADMGPDGMPTMKAPAKAMPASQPGLYTIEVEPGMAGNWALQVAAKVQGETETVRATLPVKLGK
jgi:YtkA-like